MADKDRFYESFRLMADLTDYAEKQKHRFSVGTTEQAYWQGTADACRKIGAAMRGDDLWSELFPEVSAQNK